MKKRLFFIILLLFLLCINVYSKNVLTGDIISDGRITASDARTVLRVSAKLEKLKDASFAVADADKNEKITSADARKILRIASKLENAEYTETPEVIYVNEFMPSDGNLSVFSAGCENKKQDGFVFIYNNEILVLDGGAVNTGDDSVYTYLMNIRKELLPESVDNNNTVYKLKITSVISHFHTDHTNTYAYDILPSPYIEIDRVYIPEQSVFEHTELYKLCNPDYYADGVIKTKGRLLFMDTLNEYSPDTQVFSVPFGETLQIKSSDSRLVFELFAPSEDWGTPVRAEHLLDLYYDGGEKADTADGFPKSVVNANSMWMKVTFEDRTMLFTGDVMKKAKNAYSPDSPNYAEEPFDVMLSYYASECGEDVFDTDIVKFPHHGQLRAAASKGVFEVFTPEFVICTAKDFRKTTVANAQKFWDAYQGTYCLSDGNGMYILTDGKAVTVKKDNGTAGIFDSDGKRTGIKGEILVK